MLSVGSLDGAVMGQVMKSRPLLVRTILEIVRPSKLVLEPVLLVCVVMGNCQGDP